MNHQVLDALFSCAETSLINTMIIRNLISKINFFLAENAVKKELSNNLADRDIYLFDNIIRVMLITLIHPAEKWPVIQGI